MKDIEIVPEKIPALFEVAFELCQFINSTPAAPGKEKSTFGDMLKYILDRPATLESLKG